MTSGKPPGHKFFVCAVLVAAILQFLGSPGEVQARIRLTVVNLGYVSRLARQRAARPFVSPERRLPSFLRAGALSRHEYSQIQFRHSRALWAADRLPFRLEFFHPGCLYQEPEQIFEFTPGYTQRIGFNSNFFDYGRLRLPGRIPTDTGYAGFRILCRLNSPDKFDELGTFLGKSFFRLLGRGQSYGPSARGLALDCGEGGRPEEFPLFTDWWIQKPRPGDARLHLFALLDSVSCTGAYEFYIMPGDTTIADINAVIYLREPEQIQRAMPGRKPLLTLGLAPLSTTFLYGENSERYFDDYRPEVHDSDGLLLRLATGETVWRPLDNARITRHQTFAADNIRGFGLMQRDRNFKHYEDASDPFQRSPSVWVEPHGDWGAGDIHLVELSVQRESFDNVVAFWSPKTFPKPLEPLRVSYTQFWTRGLDAKISPDHVIATRIGADLRNPGRREFVIDFAGPKLAALPPNAAPTVVANSSANGAIVDREVFRVPHGGFWRVILKMQPKTGNQTPVALDCRLLNGHQTLTETWSYLWSPR